MRIIDNAEGHIVMCIIILFINPEPVVHERKALDERFGRCTGEKKNEYIERGEVPSIGYV